MKSYKYLKIDYDQEREILFWRIRKTQMPNLSHEGLEEFLHFAAWAKEYFSSASHPLKYIVSVSEHDGVYSLGGDLTFMVNQIRNNNIPRLRKYAYNGIDAIHAIYSSFGLPVLTIALIEGKAYGGGFECALAHDYVIATEDAAFYFPEKKFNMFPGMGAYSFLQRRLLPTDADKILSGQRILSSGEMKNKGLITHEVSRHEAPLEALYEFISLNSLNFNFNYYHEQCKKKVAALTKKELIQLTEIWLEASQKLSQHDLRKMEVFGNAQIRKNELAMA